MDEFAAEFLRLSRFAPYMVADEEKRATRFQQGLRVDIQMLLIPHQLRTYSQVLSIARDVEQGLDELDVKEKEDVRVFGEIVTKMLMIELGTCCLCGRTEFGIDVIPFINMREKEERSSA